MTHAELHHLEDHYLGKFSANNGKTLHIMQYTCPAPEFQGIKYLTPYLNGRPHHPIRYLSGLDRNITNEINQEFPSGNFYSHNISNGLILFVDGGEGRASNEKRLIACIIPCIFGIAVHQSYENLPASETHSIESKLLIFYLATKMVQWL